MYFSDPCLAIVLKMKALELLNQEIWNYLNNGGFTQNGST